MVTRRSFQTRAVTSTTSSSAVARAYDSFIHTINTLSLTSPRQIFLFSHRKPIVSWVNFAMFGPSRPHWLDQASNAFHRRPKDHAQSKWSSPPMQMYANAVYYPNYRASVECPPSSLRCDIISHVFYAFAAISDSGEIYVRALQYRRAKSTLLINT